MKKTLMVTLGLCATLLVGVSASAAPVANNTDIKTDGSVKFTPDTDPLKEGDVHTPNEKDDGAVEVIQLPGQGAQGTGPLRIQFVPNLKFADATLSAKEVTSPVKVLEYNLKGEVTKKKIAPFVQVSDERGKVGASAAWTMTVKATPFTAVDANGPGVSDVLPNSKIILNDSTLTMDYGTSAKASDLVTGPATNKREILTDGTTLTTVMETKAGQSTNGTQVSNVFHSGYEKDVTTYTGDTTTGVTFVKPEGKSPIKDVEYKSVLTWSLTDAP